MTTGPTIPAEFPFSKTISASAPAEPTPNDRLQVLCFAARGEDRPGSLKKVLDGRPRSASRRPRAFGTCPPAICGREAETKGADPESKGVRER